MTSRPARIPNRFWAAPNYLAALCDEIRTVHGSEAVHVYSAPVKEEGHGETWRGVVEVFGLANHPQTNRCYAWGTPTAGGWEITTVLAVAPITSPEAAIQSVQSMGQSHFHAKSA